MTDEGGDDRIGQHHTAGLATQCRGRLSRLEVGAGIEIVETELVEHRRDLTPAQRRIGLGPTGEVDTARRREGARRDLAELLGIVTQMWVHLPDPPVTEPIRARETMIRWTSTVPDATVAACAYRQ